jgi:hypothetical protein
MAIQDIKGFFGAGWLEEQKQAEPAPQSGLHDQDRRSFTQHPCLSIAVATNWALLSQHSREKGYQKSRPIRSGLKSQH